MADIARTDALVLARPARVREKRSWAWLGVVPFFLFALLFLILPTLDLVAGVYVQGISAHAPHPNAASCGWSTFILTRASCSG